MLGGPDVGRGYGKLRVCHLVDLSLALLEGVLDVHYNLSNDVRIIIRVQMNGVLHGGKRDE